MHELVGYSTLCIDMKHLEVSVANITFTMNRVLNSLGIKSLVETRDLDEKSRRDSRLSRLFFHYIKCNKDDKEAF